MTTNGLDLQWLRKTWRNSRASFKYWLHLPYWGLNNNVYILCKQLITTSTFYNFLIQISHCSLLCSLQTPFSNRPTFPLLLSCLEGRVRRLQSPSSRNLEPNHENCTPSLLDVFCEASKPRWARRRMALCSHRVGFIFMLYMHLNIQCFSRCSL